MSLQSIGFFGFLLIVAAVYLHLPQRWQNPFLPGENTWMQNLVFVQSNLA